MKDPYLRPAPPEGAPSLPCPPGHVAEPAGVWQGRQMEMVLDPRFHDITILRGPVSPAVKDAMAGSGWERRLTDGPTELWIRDRVVLARRGLDRLPSGPDVPRIA